MVYQFICRNEQCPLDNEVVEIEMNMKDYTNKQYCEKCGDILFRTVDSYMSNYQVKCDGFYGKKS